MGKHLKLCFVYNDFNRNFRDYLPVYNKCESCYAATNFKTKKENSLGIAFPG